MHLPNHTMVNYSYIPQYKMSLPKTWNHGMTERSKIGLHLGKHSKCLNGIMDGISKYFHF